MTRLLRYFKKREWLFALCALVFIVAQVWLELKIPDYMNVITQIAQGGTNAATGAAYEMADIWANGGYMLLCAVCSMICSIITSFFVVRIAADFSARIREALYTKVQGFSMSEISKFSTASLITRSTNDVQQVQMLITMGLQMIIKAPITAIWAITKIAGKQWQWSLAVAIAVLVMVCGILTIILLVTKKFKVLQTLTDKLNQVTRENLTGIRVVRAYNAEGYQENKFETVNDEFTNTNLFTNRTMAFLNPLMSLVMNGISLAIYWIGAYVINAASLTEFAGLYADMVVFMSYGMQIVSAFMMLAMMFMIAPRALVSAKRINEVLETKELIEDGKGVGKTVETGTVEFKDVYFRYPDGNENVLSDISFRANKGDTVAFIGTTGCGKSSVVNLVSRFYDVTGGKVLVDGHDVREYVGKYTNKPPAHEIPEDYLSDETFAAILKEAEKYVGYPYVWGGSSPSTSFDCSGFVSYVYNQCGWDFGRLGAQGLYNISTRTSNPKPGDLVFFTGTYDTPGISHVGIYVGDGWMLHCGDPISYANLNTSYWQSHFYAYGKLF